jgi:hypothetical protein
MTTTTTKPTYVIKSNINPKLTLCTNGEFLAPDMFGPGHKVGAKVYKSWAHANGTAQRKRGTVTEV